MATNPDYLSMSDEEFNNLASPPEVSEEDRAAALAAQAEQKSDENQSGDDESNQQSQEDADDGSAGVESTDNDDTNNQQEIADKADDVGENGEGQGDDSSSGSNEENDEGEDKDGQEDLDESSKSKDASEGKDGKAGAEENKDKKAEGSEGDPTKKAENGKDVDLKNNDGGETTPVNYEDFYKTIMTPFKANGKKIELKSADEAIKLMQMGANYTRKMQDLQPHRKMIMMLQNNDLLDEGKLEYLIDLDKKNPEAIKKLIKESGIDPLEIDINSDPAYLKGNHSVTDEEVNFTSVLDELRSDPEGLKTLQDINERFDQTSKDMLWSNPEVMTVLHQQRENGIYAKITDEMDRMKMLGEIAPTTPFLEAYKTVGDKLFAEVKASAKEADAEPAKEVVEPKVVATTVAKPKTSVKNGDQASAASPTRSTPRKAKEVINPLAMSDEDFLKQFEGRL